MKTLLKIAISISFIALSFSCKAQQTVPVEEHYLYKKGQKEFVKGLYFKDVNHVLDKYIGIWKGKYKNRVYLFKISKGKSSYLNITSDILAIRYKITDDKGNLIISTFTGLDDKDYRIIKGLSFTKEKAYLLSYTGVNAECGQSGQIIIGMWDNSNGTKMDIVLAPDRGLLIDPEKCKDGIEQILPTEVITLTKQ